jgi:hypothetical protein
MAAHPPLKRSRAKQYRIIATCHPPVDFFEKHVPTEMMEALWALESQTNSRLLDEVGDLRLVAPEDRVTGPCATIVMAAFTHIGFPSRFTDGSYGVYYAGRSEETAIRETVHQRELIARDAHLDAGQFEMRVWLGQIQRPLHDITGPEYDELHDDAPRPEDHPKAQAFAKQLRADAAWGLYYRSVRHKGGECIAAFRPPTVSLPTQGALLVYVWNGEKIDQVFSRSEPIITF